MKLSLPIIAGCGTPLQLRRGLTLAASGLALVILVGCSASRPAPVENRSSATAPAQPGQAASTRPAPPSPAPAQGAATQAQRRAAGSAVASGGSQGSAPGSSQAQQSAARPVAQASPVRISPVEVRPIESNTPNSRPSAVADSGADQAPSLMRSDASSGARQGAQATDSGSRPSQAPSPQPASVQGPQGGSPSTSTAAAPAQGQQQSQPVSPLASATQSPAAAASSEAAARFVWPTPGKVLEGFSEPRNMGIAIDGQLGDPVVAVADGRVIFSGVGPRGYGNLIIVKHENDLLSVYGHNRALVVREGDQVSRGQKIAELGDSDADRPKLRFEVRREGKPVDPSRYLPPR
jgi:lipoprotein NlpD